MKQPVTVLLRSDTGRRSVIGNAPGDGELLQCAGDGASPYQYQINLNSTSSCVAFDFLEQHNRGFETTFSSK